MGFQWTSNSVLALILVVGLGHPAAALRFLVVPKNAGSLALDLMAVASKLQSRGHSVMAVAVEPAVEFMKTAAARHSSNTTAEAIQYAAVPDMGIGAVEGKASSIPPAKMKTLMEGFLVPTSAFASLTVGAKMLTVMKALGAAPCKAMVADQQLMQQLKDFEADVIISAGIPVSAIGDNCGCMLSHKLGAPFIDMYPGLLKMPFNVPQFASYLTPADLKTPSGFIKNSAIWLVNQLRPAVEAALHPWQTVRKESSLPVSDSGCPLVNGMMRLRGNRVEQCKAVVEVVLASWLLENKQGLNANQVLVGPGTPRSAHPITPPEVAQFVDESPAGVVLVAFGSTAQSASLVSKQDFIELAAGFAALAPTRVLWPLKEVALPAGVTFAELGLASNTKVVPWVDYNDVLGHPNTRAILSHSGLHSLYEAAFHAVPVVSVPFMFEAAAYAERYAATGASVLCSEAPAYRQGKGNVTFTRQHVADLIRQVMQQPSFKDAAQRLSTALKTYAAHRHPYDRAADEIELAMHTYQVQHGIVSKYPLKLTEYEHELTAAAAADVGLNATGTAGVGSDAVDHSSTTLQHDAPPTGTEVYDDTKIAAEESTTGSNEVRSVEAAAVDLHPGSELQDDREVEPQHDHLEL